MKKISIFGFLSLLIMPNMPMAQSWSWETIFPNSTINDMKTLPSGETYLVGSFIQIQPEDAATTADYFLIKVDSSGNIISGFKKSPDNLGIGQLLGTDDEGNIFVIGVPLIPETNIFYLHKYTMDGGLIWARRFYVEGGIKAMDVNYARVAFTGHYKKVMRIYASDNVSTEKNLGSNCDPSNGFPCSSEKYDAFIVNFDYGGAYIWADNCYSEMQPGYHNEDGAAYTEKDYNDYGVDISIDKNQNTIFHVMCYSDEDYPIYMFIGSIKHHIGDVYNWPFILIKFDPTGKLRWAFIENNSFSNRNPNKRISTDPSGNIYQIQEHMGVADNGVGIMVNKLKPNGSTIWQKKIEPENEESFLLDMWSWYRDSLGNSYVYSKFSETSNGYQRFFTTIDKDGKLIKQFPQPENFESSGIGGDIDQNLYFQRLNTLSKFILKGPFPYLFVGNGLWSTADNWESGLKPPLYLPKWDTIYIRTSEDDSCVLDVQQVIPEGALLMVEPGSRFIVPGDILTGPTLPNPTPIFATTHSNPQGKPGDTMLFKIHVMPGEHPLSSGIEASIDLTSTGGPFTLLLNDNGMHGDEVEGDSIYSISHILSDSVTPGLRAVPFIVKDLQMRADSGGFVVTVLPTPQLEIVISQIYTGGGVSGAAYGNDFIELFNRGDQPVALEGKSVQIASGNGTDLFSANPPIVLSGTLAPGQYYLIKLAGGSSGAILPEEDTMANFGLSEQGGKIILVNGITGLPCNGSSTLCNTGQMDKILDLIGYGNANFFNTNPVPVAIRPSLTAYLRNWEGVQDTQNNSADFNNALPMPRNKTSKLNPSHAKVVISQVYTAGGGTYKNDFIELYNDGNLVQILDGWSVQYAAAGASNWQSTPLSGNVQPGQFLLISQATATKGSSLPIADIQGNIDMNTTGGTILLLKTTDLQTEACPTGEKIIDKVGYGNATCYEGSGATVATNTIRRQHGGGLDTDNNQYDLKTGALYPRNRSFPVFSNHYRNGESVLVDTRDNKTYPVKRIGLKIWTLSNLNYNQSGSKVYDNNPTNAVIYGRLYDWWQAKAAIPSGWLLPERNDWIALQNFVGFEDELKDTLYWHAPITGGNNASGFSARPAGLISPEGFEAIGSLGFWWTNTEYSQLGNKFWAYYTSIGLSIYTQGYEEKTYGFSVRCVKN
jgi:uncharacterized protein (TIGR02145 family)